MVLWGDYSVIAGLVIELFSALGVALFGLANKTMERWTALFATFLIAGGVYAELRFGRKPSEAHKELRALSDQKVADATVKAAGAHDRAAILEKETADANAHAAEIERLTAWRRLSAEQRDIILTAFVSQCRHASRSNAYSMRKLFGWPTN